MPWKDKSKYKTEAYREYMRSYQRSWHQRNKARRTAKIYERKERLWEFYIQLKATSECAHCGENHPAALQFHHRDPQEKEFDIAQAFREGYSLERIKKEIEKCIILCANCHFKEHYEWNMQNKEPFKDGLAGQFLAVEQDLSVSQEEEFAHAAENQYIPGEIDIYNDPDAGSEVNQQAT